MISNKFAGKAPKLSKVMTSIPVAKNLPGLSAIRQGQKGKLTRRTIGISPKDGKNSVLTTQVLYSFH